MAYHYLVMRLKEIIGDELFARVMDELGGISLYIPVPYGMRGNVEKKERNEALCKKVRELLEEYPDYPETRIFIMVSHEFNITYPRVYQIYKEGY